MVSPSGSSSPVSSKTTTPLQSRLQPCSGWLMIVRAASRSGPLGSGHDGVCGHIGVPPESFLVVVLITFYCASQAPIAAWPVVTVFVIVFCSFRDSQPGTQLLSVGSQHAPNAPAARRQHAGRARQAAGAREVPAPGARDVAVPGATDRGRGGMPVS